MIIQPPNHTQTPNICFDEIFKTLKEGELRIILVLIRQTFGWHKPFDRISIGQLADKSGMLKPSVCRSLNSLIIKGLVQKKKFGACGEERCYYSLVMHEIPPEQIDPNDGIETEEEMNLISNNYYQSPKETPPVSLGYPPQSPKETHKRNSSKETLQKKQQQKPILPIQKSNIIDIISCPAAVSLESSEEKIRNPTLPPSKQLCGNSGKLKPPIHENLEKVPIPKHDKIEITKRYDEKTVLHALEWAFHPQTRINKDLAPAIKWACKIKPEIPKTKKTEIKKIPDYVSANRTMWRCICDAMKKLPRICDFREIEEYIEIPNGKLYFKDVSFIDQVENFFRKQDVMTPTLTTYMKKMKGEFLNLCS